MDSATIASLKNVTLPVNQASGLPNEFYTDKATLDEERRLVFFDNWAGIGFAKDIPDAGDANPITFLGMPLLAVRDRDGGVRVYQNTCRHRGMILVEEKTKLKGVIRCPYHSWCYGLDGALKSTPHVGGPEVNHHPDIKRDELGLCEIRSHVWQGVIFVNISGTAPEFDRYAADIKDRWREFEKPIYHSGPDSSFTLDVACNWKLAVENYCESYHLPWVHPSLNSYSRIEDHYNITATGAHSGQGTLVYRPMLDADGRRFPDFEGLSEKWDTGAEYLAFYPNVLFGVHRDHTFAIILEPVDCENTREHVSIFYSNAEAIGPDWSDMRERNTALWKTVFAEDVFVVEGMQKGRHGLKFDGGRFSPVLDEPTHAFHDWVARRFLNDSKDRIALAGD